MALTPAERRQRRDERARQIVNPDTGQPFRNYNQLDTWQRNQKAKAAGFTGRGQQRYRKTKEKVEELRTVAPQSFDRFLGGRPATEQRAREFERAFGKMPRDITPAQHAKLVEARKAFVRRYPEWNWKLWRDEYNSSK